jgi:hypothetical protein
MRPNLTLDFPEKVDPHPERLGSLFDLATFAPLR